MTVDEELDDIERLLDAALAPWDDANREADANRKAVETYERIKKFHQSHDDITDEQRIRLMAIARRLLKQVFDVQLEKPQ